MEGEKVVRRALESGWPLASLLLTPEWAERLGEETLTGSRRRPPTIVTVERSVMRAIVGFRPRQGIFGEGMVPPVQPAPVWIDGLPDNHLIVALDGLTDAENVGAVVRNAAAFGAGGVVVDGRSPSPFLRRAVRVSMGGVFQVPVYSVSSLADTLLLLRQRRGTRLAAADPSTGAVPLSEADMRGDLCVVFGAEGAGLSERLRDMADIRLTIPMAGGPGSLNVAAASAVVLYHRMVMAERSRKDV